MRNLLILFLVLISLNVYSNVSKSDSLNSETKLELTNKSSESQENTIGLNESDSYYKMLYENTKESNSKLLSLLTTSLTVIIAVIIAIIGSSIFYNYRFNKKEYELLTKETSARIEEIQSKILEKTNDEIEKLKVQNRREIAKQFHQLSDTYKTNYETIKDSLNTIISSFKQDIDNNIDTFKDKLKEIEKTVEQIEKSAEKDLNLKEKVLSLEIASLKGEIYSIKGWYGLALTNFIEEAFLCVETNNNWRLEYVATDILNMIDETIKTSNSVTPTTKMKLEKVLTEFPSYSIHKKKNIEEKFKNVKIEEVKLPKRDSSDGLLSSLIN